MEMTGCRPPPARSLRGTGSPSWSPSEFDFLLSPCLNIYAQTECLIISVYLSLIYLSIYLSAISYRSFRRWSSWRRQSRGHRGRSRPSRRRWCGCRRWGAWRRWPRGSRWRCHLQDARAREGKGGLRICFEKPRSESENVICVIGSLYQGCYLFECFHFLLSSGNDLTNSYFVVIIFTQIYTLMEVTSSRY